FGRPVGLSWHRPEGAAVPVRPGQGESVTGRSRISEWRDDQDHPYDADRDADPDRGGAGATEESRHQSRHRARGARDLSCTDTQASVTARPLPGGAIYRG